MSHYYNTGMALTGDWRRLNSVMRNFSQTADEINAAIQYEAEKAKEILIQAMLSCDGENAESWATKKGHSRPWVDKGTFTEGEGIIIEEYAESAKKRYYVIRGNPNIYSDHSGRGWKPSYAEIAEMVNDKFPVFDIAYDQIAMDLERSIMLKTYESFRRNMR